jgi:hypothetical protein
MATGRKTDDILNALSTSRPEQSELVIVLRMETATICAFQNASSSADHILNFPTAELNTTLEAFQVSGKDFDDVTVFFTDIESTLMPIALSSEECSKDYLNCLYQRELGSVLSNQSSLMGMEVIYTYSKEWHEKMLSMFPQAHFHHISELVILATASTLQHHGDYVLHAHLEEEHLFVMTFKGKDLVFFNTFPVKGETDVLYFILHSMDSLGIDYQVAAVQLSGYHKNMKSVTHLLKSYCPQAQMPRPSDWEDDLEHVLSKHRLCAS